MSEKIRKGNDIRISWSLYDADEHPYNLEGRNIAIELDVLTKRVRIPSFSVSGNTVTFTYYGKDQKYTGSYALKFIENEGSPDMVTFDTKDAFVLVEHSWLAVDAGETPETIQLEVVTLESALNSNIGPKGDTGDPAGFGTVDAEADNSVGTPTVEVQTSGPDTAKNFHFVFRNIKGSDASVTRTNIEAALDSTEGKNLSTEDYTTAEKSKLAGVESGAEVNILEGVQVNGTDLEVSGKKVNVPVPTALSQLSGDSTHRVVTDAEKTAWGAKYDKPSGGIPASDIASGVIPDVSQFITKSVDDLVNYYLKSDTYTKAEVQALIGAINQFHYEVYASLEDVTEPASNVLYLIGPTGSGTDKYKEYVWPNATAGFVLIGDTSVDLSGYVTTTALNTALADYTTTTDLTTLLAGKQDVISDLSTIRSGASAGSTAYQKPSGGVPKADLDSGVQTSLDKADSAVQDVSGKEDKTNKTVQISAESTDTEYPSAKAVYSELNGIQENLIGGDLIADTPTEREIGYSTTAGGAEVGKMAKIQEVRGWTGVWNQLAREFSSTYWQGVELTDLVFNEGGASFTPNNDDVGSYLELKSLYPITNIQGHKYYIAVTAKKDTAGGIRLRLGAGYLAANFTVSTTYARYSSIATSSGSGYNTYNWVLGLVAGVKTYVKDLVVIDLTLLFGAGNEPSTVAEFEALYPLGYFDYCAARLINNAATGLQSTGTGFTNTLSLPITTATGKLNGQGESVVIYPEGMRGFGGKYDSIISENNELKTAIVSFGSNNLGGYDYVKQGNLYTTSGFVPSNANMLTPAGKAVVWNQLIDTVDYKTPPSGFTIIGAEIRLAAGTYENTAFSFVDQRGLPNGKTLIVGHKYYLGGARQELEKVYLRCPDSDASAINAKAIIFTATSVSFRFNVNVLATTLSADATFVPIVIDLTQMFGEGKEPTTVAEFEAMFPLDYYAYDAGSLGIVANGTYSDAATFKTAMSGVPLYYELDTPLEYTLDTPFYARYLVEAGGTEAKLPADTASAVTAPLRCAVKYALNAASILSDISTDGFVSATRSQSYTSTQKAQARTNIGAGTSNFSGNYNDLTNKPTIPTVPTISTDIEADKTSDTKTASPKAVYDSLGKYGVISQTQTWSYQTQTSARTYTMSNLVYGLIPQYFIDLAISRGAVFNTTTGYFELNGLTDISYQEMIKILRADLQNQGIVDNYNFCGARTNLPPRKLYYYQDYYIWSGKNFGVGGNTLEVLAVSNNENGVFTINGNGTILFNVNNNVIRKVIGVISLAGVTSINGAFFQNDYSLEEIKIKGLKANISSLNGQSLSLASVVYMVENAENTSAITITLHATAYARCQADTTEYEYNEQTYTGILAYASAKNITIASA